MKILLIVVAVVLFMGTSLAEEKTFFFEGWDIVGYGVTPQGYIQLLLANPDPKGDVQKVIVLIHPNGVVLAYCFFDKFNNPYSYVIKEDGKYERNSEHEKTCFWCHKERKKMVVIR